MQVTNYKNVNIYNLSHGKSLPDWLSDRKRRLLQKKDVDVRRRIELIQDFEMPGVSNEVRMTRDGRYIFATGVYKPRIRCYDVNNLSMKFERCFDAEAVHFEMLSDDYSKFALLQCDRSVELHVQYGSYYKFRIPKFGRDMIYHRESCDLLLVGASSEIYRYNLEQGRFLNPFKTNASSVNKIAILEDKDFIICGTIEGTIEAWDPRMRERITILDCALSCMTDQTIVEGFPSITSLKFKGDLTLAVGTFTGQVMLYDIRNNKPFLVKNHSNGLPIKSMDFIESEELVASVDPKCVKIWKQNSGKSYATILAPGHDTNSCSFLNDLCIVPNSGLFFLANEGQKILSYFIPGIGHAPKWCGFLDNITEELEESKQDAVYDDYQFVTCKELEQLHLEHLIGTNLLRAYMHGYFMDIRLYKKAKAIVQPEAYQDLKKKMAKTKLDKERSSKQIVVKQLPNVNRGYAQKLLEKKTNDKQFTSTPFDDDRFKEMFENPDFEIKETDDEYTRIKHTVERANKKKVTLVSEETPMSFIEEDNKLESSEESSSEDYSDSESDQEKRPDKKQKRMFEAVDSEDFHIIKRNKEEEDNLIPIEERLKKESFVKESNSTAGNKVAQWNPKRSEQSRKREKERKAHLQDRAKFRRPANLRK